MQLVSVIIPVYNAMPFFKETMTCVIEQTYSNIEIIIIDDGSTDESLHYLESLSLPNLVVKHNKGKGACAARNYGMELATGDYIQFLDADDLLDKDKLQIQVEALDKNRSGIGVCSTKHFYDSIDNGKITDHEFLFTTSNTKDFLLNLYGSDGKTHNMVGTSAWLTPKALIEKAGPWDETLSKDQDGEFFCRVVAAGTQVIYTPEVLNYYRKHIKGTNIANQRQKRHLESQLKALYSKSQQFIGLEQTDGYKKAMALQYKIIAINAYPEFKALSKQAIHLSKTFGGSNYLPVLGGKIIEIVKRKMGWRTAKLLSYWVHKIGY
ncbi:MAG: glycosyltransferase family 2 protein [Psychroserpens sp.]|uniref:glycosyltransferase family 2 protein n=1 Tax=Psychroserpens sp. TaxID=2020870 RepID=UPI003001D4B6